MINKTQIVRTPSKTIATLDRYSSEFDSGRHTAKWGMVNGFDWSQKPSDARQKRNGISNPVCIRHHLDGNTMWVRKSVGHVAFFRGEEFMVNERGTLYRVWIGNRMDGSGRWRVDSRFAAAPSDIPAFFAALGAKDWSIPYRFCSDCKSNAARPDSTVCGTCMESYAERRKLINAAIACRV
jgi:hypothetical protein